MVSQEPFEGDAVFGSELDEQELKEQAIRLALAGHPLETAVGYLQAIHQEKQKAVQLTLAQRKAEILGQEARVQGRVDQVAAAQRSVQGLREDKEALEDQKRSLQAEITKLEACIRAKRRQGRADAIVKEATRRIERAREEPKQRLETELAFRQKVFDIEEKCWNLNKTEYDRRAEILKEELDRTEQDLAGAKERAEQLKRISVTRTVAGFLVWAGYLGFAATGSAVSYVLYKRIPKGNSPSEGIGHFLAGLSELGEPFGPLGKLAAPFLFLLLLLALFAGIIWACDQALKRFDGRWTRRLKRSSRQSQRRQTESRVEATPPLTQFFQLPFIERASFIQLLASLPYLFAAGVLFFLISTPAPLSTSEDALQSLAPNYIGAVYSLLATAAFLLYALYIVLPRMNRALGENHKPSLVKTNWELVALLSILILALAIAALAPNSQVPGDVYSRVTWGGIAIAMTLSSMGLAYGLIFIGLFKDVEKYERLRRQIRTAIESFSVRPIIEVGSLIDLDAVQEHFADLQEEGETFEFIRSIYDTTVAFSTDPEDFSTFLDLWLKAVEPKGTAKQLFSRSKLRDSLQATATEGLDFEHAPEESQFVHDRNLKLLAIEADLRRIEQERSGLELAIASYEEEQRAWMKSQSEARFALAEAELRASRLAAQLRQRELIFCSAFALGLRYRLPNPSLPPIPAPPTFGESAPN